MNEFEVCNEENTQLSVFTPLDALLAEYKKVRASIERVSAMVLTETAGLMDYFIQGASVAHNTSGLSARYLFELEPAIKCLDAEFWSRAMALTDVLEAMDATKRNEWNDQIRKHETPPFEPDSVIETIRTLLSQCAHFMAQRVDGLFHNLSREHITNTPQGFGKRFIIDRMMDTMGYPNESRAGYVHDLRCLVAKFTGRDAPVSRVTSMDLQVIMRNGGFGEWHDFDGGSWKIKLFLKGTAHLEVHPEMARRLNSVLASLYPSAIPESFRRKPAKAEKVKEFEMHLDLIPFRVIEAMRSGRFNSEGTLMYFTGPVESEVAEVLMRIGGVQNGRTNWLFDFDAKGVVDTMYRTGGLPEQRSHQFYATKEELARRVVEMAEISMEHSVLEPEAGQGGLADFLPNRGNVTCMEISQLHCDILRAKGYKTVGCGDFLVWNRNRFETFDRIVMNPPFSGDRAFLHLQHAARMLNPDGILVAILPSSMRGKELIEGRRHEWSEVICDAFDDTGVSVAILKLS